MHKSKALAVYDGSPGLFYYINKQHGYPTAEFRDEDNKTESPLPSDFKVLVLDSKSRSEETWNHDYSRGIAISLKRNEVIYWAGAW